MTGFLLALSGCCGGSAPVWEPIPEVHLGGESASLDLAPYLSDDRGVPIVTVARDPDVLVAIDGLTLELTPQPGWRGQTTLAIEAADACGNVSVTELVVHGGQPVEGDCFVDFTWEGSASAVFVAGPFNDWDPEATPMVEEGGRWTASVPLPPGDHPYKFVVRGAGGFDNSPRWTCDPAAEWIQCDPGYKAPSDTNWSQTCTPGAESCNSVVRVRACDAPELELASLDIDRAAGRVDLVVDASDAFTVTVDGAPFAASGPSFSVGGLAPGRHVIEVRSEGADPLVIPVWTDDFTWEQGTMYFAFIDRMRNGDPSNDGDDGATAEAGRYLGGDFVGLRQMLPYLDDLGVSVLWISNAQDNAEGAWPGDCGRTYTGYHAYWPGDPEAIEERFGTEAELNALIDDAHARGMRVVMDWVANHVHETHPWATEHPDWFNAPLNCLDYTDGQIHFDRFPETCRFAPYLPDIDYTKPEPLFRMIDDAVGWAQRLRLDGFRVDAVKHMPHAVVYDLNTAVERRIQHRHAGGDQQFWTIGETFDGANQVAAYVDDRQLDGQFDFPLYWSLRGALAHDAPFADVWGTMLDSEARYPGALMSVFLGNHDVARFSTDATRTDLSSCRNGDLVVAPVPGEAEVYERMMLGLTVVFTQTGVPLVYYGDEFGMPGYGDPDNRHPLWWYADWDGVTSAEQIAEQVGGARGELVRHVRALAQARRAHPAFAAPNPIQWWIEPGVLAYARSAGSDHVLVVANRDPGERWLTNGLSFAGLPQGTWRDVLTGDTFTSDGDQLTVHVGGRRSRVLVRD